MSWKKHLSLLATFLMLLGCFQANEGDENSNNESDDSTEEPTSLDVAAFGGYDTDDEDPFFNMDDLQEVLSDDYTITAAIDEDTEDELSESGDYNVYRVRFVWGNLKLNAREEVITGSVTHLDWSGSVTLDGDGYLFLKRTIRFDAHDEVLDNEEASATWESYTGPHIDGILVKLLVPVDADPEATTLTFSTETLELSIAISELDDQYNEIVTIDDDGHGIATTGLKIEEEDCAMGFMQGRYHQRRSRPGSVFRGRIVTHRGDLHGHIRGHSGQTSDGEKLFFGKYISTEGGFRGRMRGDYDGGAFSGSWHNRNGEHSGILDGKYVTGEEVDTGFFQGFWEETCE